MKSNASSLPIIYKFHVMLLLANAMFPRKLFPKSFFIADMLQICEHLT